MSIDWKKKRLFLLDMDGTMYLDEDIFPCTIPFLNKVKEIGGRYLFLTNNSSKGVKTYVEKCRRLGIDANEEDFLTSVHATEWVLKQREPYREIYVSGTQSFIEQMKEAGFPVTTVRSEKTDCLIHGNDTELTFQKLEDSCILLNKGVDFYGTNPDWVCPTWYGSAPDCGSVCEMLFRATGRRPIFIGKPEPTMIYLAMERCGYSKEETVVIGDRVYTDVASGVNAGIDSVLVLSGEGTRKDVEESNEKPTEILQDLGCITTQL